MQRHFAVGPLELRLLVIDDDRDDLELLCHHLATMPDARAEVVSSQDPDEALQVAADGCFDLILLDYHLGAVTGLEVYLRLRDRGLDAPVILLTDKGNEVIAVECLKAGMSDYIPKGVANPSNLRRAIGNAFEKSCLRRELDARQRKVEQTLQDLRARNEEIQSFYHTLSHELKTPLTAAREFVCILLDGLEGPVNEEQRQCLERTRACCDQMVLLLNDILDTTRLETGKLAIDPRPSALVAVADQALAHCRPAALRGDVRLELSAQPGIEQACFDPERVLQVLTNLILNAVKWSPRGSTVTLRIEDSKRPGDVRLSVVDKGTGIPAELHGRIFERLYQVNRADTAIHGGLGIGLYLCRELVRLHGREIELESAPGKGSTFSFQLPKASSVNRGETLSKGETK